MEIGVDERVLYRAAFGARVVEPAAAPMSADTIFDLASLTKVIATTPAIMQLVQAGRLDLDRPVADYWPAFAAEGKAAITLRQLLTHTSGLPPDLALASEGPDAPTILASLAAVRPLSAPGERFVYSDLNFLALGALVGRVSGQPLDAFAASHIFQPLGMSDTGFDPPPARQERIAPSDLEDGAMRWGQAQDPTAYRMGGVAGHAGLFSTAGDLARFARMLLNGGALDGARVLRPQTVAEMIRPSPIPGGVRRALGWDVSSPLSMGMDQAFGGDSFGHTGYTGVLIWIDPATHGYLIVLTSRLHPDGAGDAKPLRQDLGPLAAALIRADLADPGRHPSVDRQ